MNKINPLYIVAVLLLVIFILYIKISSMQNNANILNYSIGQTKQVGGYFNEMKKEFGDKQQQVKTIKDILKTYSLLKSPHSFKVNSNDISIDIKNISTKVSNKLVSKLLNKSIIISSFSIKDVDFNQSITMKIKL